MANITQPRPLLTQRAPTTAARGYVAASAAAPGSAATAATTGGLYAYAMGLGRPLNVGGYGNTPLYGPAPKQGYPSPARARQSNRQQGGSVPGGYVAEQGTYQPGQTWDYQPPLNDTFEERLPRGIGQGVDGGVALAGTYHPRDFAPGTRMLPSLRSAPMWMQTFFPGQNRPLITSQAVQRYALQNSVVASRPLNHNDYFLGYRVSQSTASAFGGSGVTRGLGN